MIIDDIQLPSSPNEPKWLGQLRKAGLKALQTQGFPTRKTEAWKYTPCQALLKLDYNPVTQSSTVTATQIAPHLLTDGDYLVFVDGLFSPSLSRCNDGICSITHAINKQPMILEHYLGRLADINEPGFVGLNMAMLQEGAFIHIKQSPPKPIQLLFIASQRAPFISHLRNLLIIEPQAKVCVIEQHIALDNQAQYISNTVTETFMGAESELTYYKLQQESPRAFHLNTQIIAQQANSQLQHFAFDCGAQLARNGLHTKIQGEKSRSQFNGLYLVGGEQHIDNHTHLEHAVAHTQSEQYYKGIMTDKGHGVFNGQITVAPQAQKTQASQQNRNLLLAKTAIIDTKPELQIHADDVKCAHGATIGQLDKTALFYLQTRGIDSHQAKAMLTHGFANEVIHPIGNDTLKNYLEQQVQQWLESHP